MLGRLRARAANRRAARNTGRRNRNTPAASAGRSSGS